MSNIESQILVVCLQLWNPSNSRKFTPSFLAESGYGSGHICSPSSLASFQVILENSLKFSGGITVWLRTDFLPFILRASFLPKCKFDPRISLEKLIMFCIEHVSAVNLVIHVSDL